jgi:DNA-binding transcriptional LysR family regulator
LLKRFQDSYPNVEISSYVGTSESQIKSYEADVSIIPARYPPQDMVAKKIGTTVMHYIWIEGLPKGQKYKRSCIS